jgi:stearoyl-CoA desaturase (delta-9 desaturase)
MVRATVTDELKSLKLPGGRGDRALLRRCRKWLAQGDARLAPGERDQMARAMTLAPALSTLVQMRQDLTALWESSSASSEQLLADLRAWCQRAQASGIDGLEQFAYRLRRYAL